MKLAISNIISSIARSEAVIGGVAVTLRASPRAKRLRLRLDPRTRTVLLTVPKRISTRRALLWAESHRDWIERRLAELPAPAPLGQAGVLPFRGVPYRIDWEQAGPRRPRLEDGCVRVGGSLEGLNGRLLRWLRAEALALLRAETADYGAKAGVMAAKVGVGDPLSRWGSCSNSGTIRYSWRLVLAPDFVRRATVAHEVAHLVHLNHGPAFHALVETLYGDDPRPARAWLRANSAALHALGRA